jgi:hypothetical protein
MTAKYICIPITNFYNFIGFNSSFESQALFI